MLAAHDVPPETFPSPGLALPLVFPCALLATLQDNPQLSNCRVTICCWAFHGSLMQTSGNTSSVPFIVKRVSHAKKIERTEEGRRVISWAEKSINR